MSVGFGLGRCWDEWVRCPIDLETKKKVRGSKEDSGGKRKKSGEWVPRAMPHQHLTVI